MYGPMASAQDCRPASSMTHPLTGTPMITQSFAAWLGTYSGITFNAHHGGVDFAATVGTVVRAPANGRIERLTFSPGPNSIGGLLVIRHTGPLAIPANSRSGSGVSNFTYVAETPRDLLSSLLHIQPRSGLRVGDCVTQGQDIATVTQMSLPAHLHYEIGLGSQQRSTSGQTFGRASNLSNGGYYRNAQVMVDDGARDPIGVLRVNSNLAHVTIADRWLWRCAGTFRSYFGSPWSGAYTSGSYRVLPVTGAPGYGIDNLAVLASYQPDQLLYRWGNWYSLPLLLC
ncbi:MAG: M23 family peptidase [Xanthomonadales bacterium PRO6]|nr:M23 family peptidase [Xanthomonadales bacterium PRO6]